MFKIYKVYFRFVSMFFLIDAFTAHPFHGNPAGVVILDYKDILNKQLAQRIASYFNWSEISFVQQIDNSTFKINWFSPKDEAPLCGHATLAAAHVIFKYINKNATSFDFIYNDGTLHITRDQDSISMLFPIKPVIEVNNPNFDVLHVLNVDSYIEIMRDDLVYMVILDSYNTVANLSPNFEAISKLDARSIIVTARTQTKFDFCSRYFAPKVGIPEDPVCGSAHCRLGYYWSKKLEKNDLKAFQCSKRAGILNLHVIPNSVKITGTAITVAQFANVQFV